MHQVASLLTTQLDSVKDMAQEYVSALATPAQLLCGLFAFGYIGFGIWGSWARGQKIDFYGLLRPFSVGLIILFFSGFVSLLQLTIYPIELAASSLNTSVQENYQQAQTDYAVAQERVRNAMAVYNQQQIKEEITDVPTEVSPATDDSSNYLQLFKNTLHLLVSFSSLALTGMVYFFRTYVVLAGVVLLLIGPFAFALSLLPGFSGNIKNWLARYVHIAMYIPLSLLVSFVVAVLFSGCVYPVFTNMLSTLPHVNYTFSDYQQAENLQLSVQLITLLFNSIAIGLYACIPVFSKWIIHSDYVAAVIVRNK
jgi:ABC-type dipeptide/oligopeptide/nickel transport system permease subunit